MSAPLVIWVFMLLFQQSGMAGGAGADRPSCLEARAHMIADMKEMGQVPIALSDCIQITLTPPSK